MTLIKKEANEAQKAQEHADYIAKVNREEKEWRDEFNKMYPETTDSLRSVDDIIDFIKNRWSTHSSKPNREDSDQETQKKKCLNCGSTQLVRQYDETKTTQKDIVWTDEYRCLTCKERFVL